LVAGFTNNFMKNVVLFLIFGLGACSAADGKWPSLLTSAQKNPSASSSDPAFSGVPVIGANNTSVAPSTAIVVALQPMEARLEQEARAFEFAKTRLVDLRAAVVAAPKSRVAKNQLDGFRIDLTDQRASILAVLADIAMQPASPMRDRLALQAGTQLAALDIVLTQEGIAAEASLLQTKVVVQKFQRAQLEWKNQAKTLRTSLSAVKVRGPDDSAWNAAQIELTRVNQTAKQFTENVRNLERTLGRLVVDALPSKNIGAEFNSIGDQLRAIAIADTDNFALLQEARTLLEKR
jgi:hypothetical protein